MRVLFLTSVGCMDMEDFASASLVEVLGRENVVDFPWKPSLHYTGLAIKNQISLYRTPRNMAGYHPGVDAPVFQELNGLLRPGSSLKDIFDAVIVGAHRIDPCVLFHEIRKIRSPLPPVILLDGEEHYDDPNEASPDLDMAPYVDWIFKQVYKKGDQFPKTSVLPCPANHALYRVYGQSYSYKVDSIDPVVHFAGEASGDDDGSFRSKSIQAICDAGLPLRGGMGKKLPYIEYLSTIKRSQINLSFGGAVYSTRRYWEIPAIGGFLLAERPCVDQGPNDLVEGEHCDFFGSTEELMEKCHYWLGRPDEAKEIGKKAAEHVWQHHGLRSRGEEIVRKINELNR